MHANGRKRRLAYGEVPIDKHITIADEQVKKLLTKQLHTQTSIPKELETPKRFTDAVLVKDTSRLLTGAKSLSEFREIQQEESKIVELREAGLNEHDIEIKLQYMNGKLPENETKKFKKRLDYIESKIKQHSIELAKPTQYTGSVSVTRKEYELDQATHRQDSEASVFSHLVKKKRKTYLANDPVFATLNAYEEEKEKRNVNADEVEESNDGAFVGPVLAPINERVIPIPEELIHRNRMELSDMLALEKFRDYRSGPSNNVLYVKNLAKSTTVKDLARLFVRFYEAGNADVTYKMMSGRMHGQAFVTFKDELVAQKALLLCNGYILNGKPMVISYGKKKLMTQ